MTTYFLNRLIRHICLLKFLRIPAANLCFRPVLLLLIFLYPIFHFIFTPIQEIRYEVLFGWFFGHVTRHYFPNQGQNHQCPLQWKWEVLTMDHVCEIITLDKKKLRMWHKTVLEKITSIKILWTSVLQRWFRFSDPQASKKNAGFLDSTNQPLMQIPGHITPALHLNLFIYSIEIIVLVYSNICYKTQKRR